jgi:hypothetical protein
MNRKIRLIFAVSIWQFILHMWQCLKSGDPRLWPPHAVAFLHDLLLLWALLMVGRVIRRFTPPYLRTAGEVLSVTVLLLAGVMFAIYPQLLREYLAFPINIFATGGGSVHTLLTEYLGLWQLWPAGVALVIASSALVVPVRLPEWRFVRLFFLPIIAVLGIVTLPRSTQPFLHSLKAQVVGLLAWSARVVPPLQRPMLKTEMALASMDVSLAFDLPLTADHVFLIVLEGVTAADFENDFLTNSHFFPRVRDRATYFRRYYATNLDSYTSLIAMLTSVQVPYRAYADERLYAGVNQAMNLPCSLLAHGFFTLFVSTYAHQPFVPTRNDWAQIMDRGDLPSLEGWVSLGSNRMEAATEDRAALPTIINATAAYPKTFILHELVYGHSTEWRAKTGQSQLAYYDVYLCDLLDRLNAKGLGSHSLFVIVSDHGDRAKASVAENYRLPLLVVGQPGIPAEDMEFRSHLDLQRIVVSYLTKTALPPPRMMTHVVGSSERWVYGIVEANGDHLFIDDESGTISSMQGGVDAMKLFEAFQSSLNAFAVLYGQ